MGALLHDCHSMLPAAPTATASVASASGFQASADALIDIPFLPWRIRPFRPVSPRLYASKRSDEGMKACARVLKDRTKCLPK